MTRTWSSRVGLIGSPTPRQTQAGPDPPGLELGRSGMQVSNTGAAGTDTAWINVVVCSPHGWMAEYGDRLADVWRGFQVLRRGQRPEPGRQTCKDEAVASTSMPQYHKLIWPAITALKELGGSASVRELYERVVEDEDFSEEQQAVEHGGTSEIDYRLRWALTHLKGIGARQQQRARRLGAH